MSQAWFRDLDAVTVSGHPLSEHGSDKSDDVLPRESRPHLASRHVLDESMRRGLLSNLHVKQFFQTLTNYTNNLVQKLSQSAIDFYRSQFARGIPV